MVDAGDDRMRSNPLFHLDTMKTVISNRGFNPIILFFGGDDGPD